MAKLTISNIPSGFASTTALNTAFDAIETELNSKVLYRNNPVGEPNQMENDLDMNSNDILNVATLYVTSLYVNGESIATFIASAAASASAAANSATAANNSAVSSAASAASSGAYASQASSSATNASNSANSAAVSAALISHWEFIGAWLTGTVYFVNNIVTEGGESFIALVDHTSGTFATDYSNLKWAKLAAQGAPGPGSGDLLSTNNLSDVANTAIARGNLGAASSGTNSDITSLTNITGNISFAGAGNWLQGDFSNAAVANRAGIRSTTTNGNTHVDVFPNGIATSSTVDLFNSSNQVDSGVLVAGITATEAVVDSNRIGTGTYLPLQFKTSNTMQLEIATNGEASFSSTGALKVHSGTTAERPTGAVGKFRFNTSLGRFEGHNGTSWGSMGGATGGGSDDAFYENTQTITADYTVTSGKNAMTAGPVTVNAGITVTVPAGSTWHVL